MSWKELAWHLYIESSQVLQNFCEWVEGEIEELEEAGPLSAQHKKIKRLVKERAAQHELCIRLTVHVREMQHTWELPIASRLPLHLLHLMILAGSGSALSRIQFIDVTHCLCLSVSRSLRSLSCADRGPLSMQLQKICLHPLLLASCASRKHCPHDRAAGSFSTHRVARCFTLL